VSGIQKHTASSDVLLSMHQDPAPIVAVHPATALAEHGRLLGALAQAFAVTFVPWSERATPAALVVAPGAAIPAVAPTLPVLAFVAEPDSGAVPATVTLACVAAVDRRLHGAELHDHPIGAGAAPADGDDALATTADGRPCWTQTPGTAHQRVWTALSDLRGDDTLRAWLHTERALGLVALVQLLRGLRDDGWSTPPLRAAFVFDDPNLRHPTYGFLDFRTLLTHAERHDYHASMAMIPLDARWAKNREAVRLFAQHPQRLSLNVHGNNHVRRELLADLGRDEAIALGAQALRRVRAFERRTGLGVDRVMMPPHGMCSPSVVDGLARLPFDTLSTIHPCPWTERPPADQPLAGWAPADFVTGCAVLPRFPLVCSHAEMALRAFLDQPLVLYGHHDDLADGLAPLAAAAERVGRIGDVRWMSLRAIAEGSYALRHDGETAELALFSRRVAVTLPAGIRRLTVQAPGARGRADGLSGWSLDGDGRPAQPAAFGESVALTGDGPIDVRLLTGTEIDPATVPAPAWRPWPVLRRAGTEVRDRLLPLRPAQTT
jgi:hypothetical protein